MRPTWAEGELRHICDDVSSWFQAAIKDPELASEARAIEDDPSSNAVRSRVAIREAIERRYTAPAQTA